MAFAGFSERTTAFLAELRSHNDKTWFHEHRDDYQADLIEPARDFVEALGPLLSTFAPGIRAEPKIGGAIMRMNRDIRFSRDKTLYKDHLDMIFREGAGKGGPGFWFRLTPDTLTLGAGIHDFDKTALERYRHAVDDDVTGTALVKVVATLDKAGYGVGGEHYKRVPAGFDADHPRADLLRYNTLFAGIELDLPAELATPRFPKFCAAHYRKMNPLTDWLATSFGSAG